MKATTKSLKLRTHEPHVLHGFSALRVGLFARFTEPRSVKTVE